MTEPARRLGALDLLTTVLDEGSWRGWDSSPAQPAPEGSPYAAELAAAADVAGTDESVITGEGLIRGRRVAVIAGEFRFLAGSLGTAAAERIVLAFERAQREELPLFAAPSSGGTRMQEGTPAFVGMVKISAAAARFKHAGLPYIVYLRHPTTGGVFASWGSLGHVTVAEPGAACRRADLPTVERPTSAALLPSRGHVLSHSPCREATFRRSTGLAAYGGRSAGTGLSTGECGGNWPLDRGNAAGTGLSTG